MRTVQTDPVLVLLRKWVSNTESLEQLCFFPPREVMLSSALTQCPCACVCVRPEGNRRDYNLTFSQNINTHPPLMLYRKLWKTQHAAFVIWPQRCLPKLTKYVIRCRMICTCTYKKADRTTHTHTHSFQQGFEPWTPEVWLSWELASHVTTVTLEDCKQASLEHVNVVDCHYFDMLNFFNHIYWVRGNWIKKECASLQLIQLIFIFTR